MDAKSQRVKERDRVLLVLNGVIEALNPTKGISSITPVKAAFGSVLTLLKMIRESMIDEGDYVELGMYCADICKVIDRGLKGRQLGELSRSVLEAIQQLTTTVAEIQKKVDGRGRRGAASRLLHAKDDKEMIASWKSDLNRILHIFNTELAIDTHMMVVDIHRNASANQGTDSQQNSIQSSTPVGELPPPPPRACFGREDLIERILGFAETLTPIALIGAGGIGKTSIALVALHHDRIKQRFGDDRRFIRCDQFPASRLNFLRRLSKVLGAGVGNPEDLISLRPFLSSKEIFLILDNVESILDPHGTDGPEIYAMVEELSHFSNICLCVTSRITTVPPDYKQLDVPTLSAGATRSAFHRIYSEDGQSELIDAILEQLQFHPLSVTLLATVAQQNRWDNIRLAREWERRQTGVLHTEHNNSLAATIEVSLSSPTFRELGPHALELLGVIAFFPQGVHEDNLDWLFPTISNGITILDAFCILSLTYRSNGFVTMLAPLRDHIRPKDPMSSPLLCKTKEHYFTRMSAGVNPNKSTFEETRWITSEDVNVEHLLDVFTSVDANSDVWDACANFTTHLHRHKPRHTVIKQKIEGLPDDHLSKPQCLLHLAELFNSFGDHLEEQRLLTHALKLERERGDDSRVARALKELSDTNRLLGLIKEGIQHAKEASEIYKRLGEAVKEAECLIDLAWLLSDDGQVNAAEETATRAIHSFPEEGQEYLVCQSHRILGNIYDSKNEREKAVFNFEAALRIASDLKRQDQLFWIHYSLARVSFHQSEFDDASAHIGRAKSHTVDNTYRMGRATQLQAMVWFRQRRLEEAMSNALCAAEVYRILEATRDLEACDSLLCDIEQAMKSESDPDTSYFNVYGIPSSPSVLPRFLREKIQLPYFPGSSTSPDR